MNKIIVGIIVAAFIIIGGIAVFMNISNNSTGNSNGSNSSSPANNTAAVTVEACDVLTESIAKEILGENIERQDQASTAVANIDLSVSNCNYTTKPTAAASGAPSMSGVGLLARVATSDAGVKSNKLQFGSTRPAGSQDVDGIGDAAFYSPQFYQLNVLKGGNWYIVSSYKDKVTNSSLELAETLAKKLKFE